MNWIKKLRNPIVQQYVIEILFPLIGYFFFDWKILIIGIYYLIDQICSQILFYRKAFWINNKSKEKKKPTALYLSATAILLIIIIEVIVLIKVVVITQNSTFIEVKEEIGEFTTSELWLLFPIVLLVYHLKDQFTFYMPRRYLNYNYLSYVKWDIIKNGAILFLFLIGAYLWMMIVPDNLIVILFFVMLKIGFDFSIKEFTIKRSLSDVYRDKSVI